MKQRFSHLLTIALTGFAIALVTGNAIAQRFHTHHYTEEDGLPAQGVRGLAQTPNGCIWVTSRGGAGCYDGTSWRKFSYSDGLERIDLDFIALDELGAPWVVTRNRPLMLARFDGERWHSKPGCDFSTAKLSTALAVKGSGLDAVVLVSTDNGELLRWREDRQKWSLLDRTGLPESIESMQFVGNRCYIVAGNRLFALDAPYTGPPTSLESPNGELYGLHYEEESDRLFYIGVENTFVQVGGSEPRLWNKHRIEAPRGFASDFLAATDSAGGLYVGNQGAFLYQHANGECEHVATESGMLTLGATSILRDREDNIWVGSRRGLTKIASRRFETFDSSHGLLLSEVSAIVQRPDGSIVLGHPGGLTFLDDELRHHEFQSNIVDSRALDLEVDADGSIWVAATWYGLVHFDNDGQVRRYGEEDGVPLPVNALLYSTDGTLWVGTGNGMCRRTEDGFECVEELESPHPKGPFVRSLEQGSDHRIYAATAGRGVLSWGPESPPAYSHANSGSSPNNVYAVLERSDGSLLIGTTVGLFELKDGLFVRSEHPRIDRPIYFIERGAAGRTWFGTNNGVFLWEDDSLRHYSVQHGLAGSETNRSATLLDDQGRFWIGTSHGVSIYQEVFDRPRSQGPTVVVLGCDVPHASKGQEQPDRILSDSPDQISFRFRAIAFADESRVRFQTRLEGLDDDWSEPHSNPLRRATYSYLPPGDYRFHVRAMDIEGQVSEAATWPTITIQQPTWNEAWFRAACAFAALVLISVALALFFQKQHANRLEGEVALRTSELFDSQRAIEREKQRLELTVANIADGVAAVSRNGNVILWNPAAESQTGWSQDEALGMQLSELLGTNELTLSGGAHYVIEGRDKRGEKKLFEVSNSAADSDDAVVLGIVVVFRDVTDKLEVDRELAREQKLESLGLLAGGIAHDFNNLLTVIIGNLSIPFPSDSEDFEYKAGVEDAAAAAKSARSLTQQLMTFSKGGEPVRAAASIRDILHDTATFFLSGANVRCEIDAAENLWIVEIDQGQIGQVFHNLLLNAREAMPTGGRIRVRAVNLTTTPSLLPEGDYVLIEVEDEGAGISQRDLEHIFDPYFSTKARGSGLGLAIAYSIIQRHGGHISVDSDLGSGTTFRIYLPASKERVPSQVKPAVPVQVTNSARILVMDDEVAIRRLVQAMLERAGYSIVLVSDGEEAIVEYVRALESDEPFDAVIMDLTVPGGMGGKETLNHLREIDPAVRAIVISGYSADPVMARAGEFGFCGTVSKPFSFEDLRKALESALSSDALQFTR